MHLPVTTLEIATFFINLKSYKETYMAEVLGLVTVLLLTANCVIGLVELVVRLVNRT